MKIQVDLDLKQINDDFKAWLGTASLETKLKDAAFCALQSGVNSQIEEMIAEELKKPEHQEALTKIVREMLTENHAREIVARIIRRY